MVKKLATWYHGKKSLPNTPKSNSACYFLCIKLVNKKHSVNLFEFTSNLFFLNLLQLRKLWLLYEGALQPFCFSAFLLLQKNINVRICSVQSWNIVNFKIIRSILKFFFRFFQFSHFWFNFAQIKAHHLKNQLILYKMML